MLTRDQLLTEIWGYDFDGETRTVDVSYQDNCVRSSAKKERSYRLSAESDIVSEELHEKENPEKYGDGACCHPASFFIILTLITYNRNLDTLEAEVRQEAKYIQAAINISGAEYLEEMDGVDWTTRVTQIDENGDVLYDTRRDSSTLENHSGQKRGQRSPGRRRRRRRQDVRHCRSGNVLLCPSPG